MRRRAVVVTMAVVATLAAACEIGKIAIPTTAPTLVVHAVLNPNFTSQVVLLERTLTGTITIPETGFNPVDPIASAGGIPVTGASVDIIDAAGTVYHGAEDRDNPTNKGKGGGVYRVPLSGTAMVLGATYRLRVRTADSEALTASTRLPAPATRATGGLTRTFNRDHDTMLVQWPNASSARAYTLRIETPFGPFFLFTDSTRFRATGALRNFFANSLQRVFIPGFRQDMVVAAVDSNFYDYYRTTNDPFTGTGIISRVTGGLGLFGSLVELNTGTITVTADQTQPIEGRFRLAPTAPGTTNAYMSVVTLYVESEAARSDLPAALSGRYTVTAPAVRSDGVVGELRGNAVSLTLLANQLAGDTVEVFTGTLHGDTLTGSYRVRGGTAVLVRSP